MIKFSQKGDYSKVTLYLKKLKKTSLINVLHKYGKAGVEALASATPKDTGYTATQWYYEIEIQNGVAKISFCNRNIINYIPIAIILQYGHATKNGGWVEGRDYINPALEPIFKDLVDDAWKEVTRL